MTGFCPASKAGFKRAGADSSKCRELRGVFHEAAPDGLTPGCVTLIIGRKSIDVVFNTTLLRSKSRRPLTRQRQIGIFPGFYGRLPRERRIPSFPAASRWHPLRPPVKKSPGAGRPKKPLGIGLIVNQ